MGKSPLVPGVMARQNLANEMPPPTHDMHAILTTITKSSDYLLLIYRATQDQVGLALFSS